MAKSLTYKRKTTEELSIKGILSEDGTTITYVDDKVEKKAIIADCLTKFAGQAVEFKIGNKSEDDLSDDNKGGE